MIANRHKFFKMLNKHQINQQMIQFKLSSGLINNLDDIDLKNIPIEYLRLFCPHLIRKTRTVLHRFYDGDISLNDILDEKVNYTVKNQDGLTVLHMLLRYRNSNRFRYANLRSVLDSPSINVILSAHVKMKNFANPCDGNGMSHFHAACMANHKEAVEYFLDNNVPIDQAINSDSLYFAGFTALHLAIRCCNLEVAEVLLKRGASIYLKNNERMTAVHMVMENYLKFANDSFLGYLGISGKDKRHANEEIAKLLLEIINSNGNKIIDSLFLSPLHIACTMMDISVAEKLLVKEDINQCIKTESEFWPGYTAMHFAALTSWQIIKELRMTKGVIYRSPPYTDYNTVKFLMMREADLLAKDVNGITPLDLLVLKCSTEEIYQIMSLDAVCREITCFQNQIKLLDLISATRDLYEFKALLNRFSPVTHATLPMTSQLWPGFTPMHLIVLFSKSLKNGYHYDQNRFNADVINNKYLQMFRELHNINKKIVIAQDWRDRTPIHLAFRLGKMKTVVKLLLTFLFDYPSNHIDDEDLSLLHIACIKDDKNLVKKLLSRSKNVNLAYKGKAINDSIETGWTPLHVAVANNSVNVVKMLLKYGADVHSKDVNTVTPIHLLVLVPIKNTNIAEMMLLTPNLRECIVDGTGLSHLHAACFAGIGDAVKKLLNSGSDVNSTITRNPRVSDKSFVLSNLLNYLGYTPLQISSWVLQYQCYPALSLFNPAPSFPINIDRSEMFQLLMQNGADVFVEDSKAMPFLFKFLRYFIANLKEDTNLQRQAKAKIGLTEVHLACFVNDLDWLKNALEDAVDVNQKLNMNLPIYAGFTPLHVVTDTIGKESYEFMKLLLDYGANVTISDAKQQTPLHIIYENYRQRLFSGSYQYLPYIVTMLKAQKDFRINPIGSDGISHFHIACNVCETAVVKKFLERGNFDVNQPIDFFSVKMKYCVAGFTPLHMAATCNTEFIEVDSQLETVDVLLKHGADPNFQNSRGNTPLHVVKRFEIFERIARGNADANILNNNGHSPLGYLMTDTFNRNYRVMVSTDQITNWLRCGCYYNAFNIFSEVGYIGLSIKLIQYEDYRLCEAIPFEKLRNLFKLVAINMPHTMRVDDRGHTVIHNAVSIRDVNITAVEYAKLIETLTKTGYDIDSQNNLGKTALHLAVKFENNKAASALLMLGADANIQDKKGKTALTCHIRCNNIFGKSERCAVLDTLIVHVKKLQFCRIAVCQSNESYVTKECSSISVNEPFYAELEEVKNVKIARSSLTLYSFISETNAVADYPLISESKKDMIDEFFYDDNISQFREKFSEVMGLLSLQYRKAIVRSELIENATVSLNYFTYFHIPELCSYIILGFLRNCDLKNLIASTYNCKKRKQIIQQEGSLLESKKLKIQ